MFSDGKLGGLDRRLAPCEDKLLEVSLKAEVKATSMLLEMRLTEVSTHAAGAGAAAAPFCVCDPG